MNARKAVVGGYPKIKVKTDIGIDGFVVTVITGYRDDIFSYDVSSADAWGD